MADIIFENLIKSVFQILLPIIIILFGLVPSQIFNEYYNLEFYVEELEKVAVLHSNSEIELELPFEIEGSEKQGSILALNIKDMDAGMLIYPDRIDIISDDTDINTYSDSDTLIQRNFLDENLIQDVTYNPDENSLIIIT